MPVRNHPRPVPFGWSPPTAPTLNALTVGAATLTDAMSPGDIVAAISGKTAASVITMTGTAFTSNKLTVSGSNVVVGSAGPLAESDTTGTYSLTETLVTATNSPRSSGPFTSITVTTPSNPLSLLNSAENAQRDAIIGVMNAGWNPNVNTVVWDDTVVIGDAVTLYNWLNGTAVSGITRNVARNQRARLSTPFINNRSNLIMDRLRGTNYSAAGKILLIESETARVNLDFRWLISGSRNIYFRNLRMAPTLTTTAFGDPNWVPGANTITITAPGTGYVVGDTLALGPKSTMYVDPVITVATVDGGGGITGVTLDATAAGIFNATTTAISATSGTGSGALLTCAPGTNPRDAMIVTVQRTGSFPLFPVVIFDDIEIGSGYTSGDPWQWFSCIAVADAEQCFILNCKFNGFQTACRIDTVLRLKRSNNDYKLGIGDGLIVVNTRANTTVGGTTYSVVFGTTNGYVYNRLNTLRQKFDGADRVNALGRLMGLFLEHTDFGQAGTGGDVGNILRWDEFEAMYGGGVTYYDAKGVRYGGGTQGFYNDDTSLAIIGGAFSCIMVGGAAAIYTGWNGDQLFAYNTARRVGALPPAGGFDVDMGLLSRKKSGTLESAVHTVRMSSMDVIKTTSGSGYVAGTLVDVGDNEIIRSDTGPAAYAAAFPTLGVVADGEGRMSYPFTDDGVETPAALRARLYDAFGRINDKGATNPATWPAP